MSIKRRFLKEFKLIKEMFFLLLFSIKCSYELLVCVDNTKKIKKGDIIAFVTLRNEAFRIEFFLKYYRALGVDHFCFVDNGSDDNFHEIIKNQSDCSVWFTTASYKKSNFGMHWLNYLLRKYGSGHWCLTVDPDEFLVYPYSEHRNLKELSEFLEGEKRESLFCLMLDMYGAGNVSETHCSSGQNPLAVAPYFDSDGYVQHHNKNYLDMFIQGGPRRRVLFNKNPDKSPALNKTPFIKWRWYYFYRSSMHCALPKRLNIAHSKKFLMPTGCLLHFKFLSVLKIKSQEEMERKEHYDESIEYKKYSQFIENNDDYLLCDLSKIYENSEQLINLGLMNRGGWF